MVMHKKEKENAKLRLGGGSWTINLDKLDQMKVLPDGFVYHTEKGEYSITYAEAFKRGFVKTMRGEQKLVVPLKCWKFRATALV